MRDQYSHTHSVHNSDQIQGIFNYLTFSSRYWNTDRWKELNRSLATDYIPTLAEKRNVDYCFRDQDSHIGLDRLRKEVYSYNYKYRDEVERIGYRSNYVNPNISDFFYDLPDLSSTTYTTLRRNTRLLNYNGT